MAGSWYDPFFADRLRGLWNFQGQTKSPGLILVPSGENRMDLYECLICGYIYNPEAGDPSSGIPPGVEFSDLPKDWVCPECGAEKDQFVIVQE